MSDCLSNDERRAAEGDAAGVCPPSIAEREAILLAPFAIHSADSAGRRYPEPPHAYRGPFQRDRDRIVHSAAFRRLSYKTQVFADEMGDYHRTRLTHTLEVASIARTLARSLALNEDLVEALALAHDIGHPPFGHAGEDVLNECLADEGGFDHNRQALRIFEEIESRYPNFPGLNLSLEVLAGQESRARRGQEPGVAWLEVQVVDAADSIAYDTHDADDALESELLAPEELLEIPLWQEASRRVIARAGPLAGDTLRRAILLELIDSQVNDLLTTSQARLEQRRPQSAREAREAGIRIAASEALAGPKRELEGFLHARVYRNSRVMACRGRAQARLRRMFEWLVARPERLPEKFLRRADEQGVRRSTADYLAGMTDRFAHQEAERLGIGPHDE